MFPVNYWSVHREAANPRTGRLHKKKKMSIGPRVLEEKVGFLGYHLARGGF